MNLLFDLDGTLTDPKDGIVQCIRFALEQIGSPASQSQDLDWCIGPPLQHSLARLLGKTQEHRAEEALMFYRQRFKEKGMFENSVYPGIREALEVLAQTHSVFVATSKPTVFAVEIAKHFGLSEYFGGIYGSELDGRNSDKSDLIAKILLENGLSAESTAMIGDREHDMIGAVKNKVGAVGALWSYGSRVELESSGAEALMESPEELLPYFLSKV